MKGTNKSHSPSIPIRTKTHEQSDWRREALDRIRRLIKEADPEVVEERKWKKPSNPSGIPVWYHDGIICTGETYKDHLRLTFADGAALKDPTGLFNANLQGVTRAIVLHEGDTIAGNAFKALIRSAAALNASSARR
ncbi:MAG: DUF1801 domain-containing protein [Thermoplasmata archaeon]